MYSVEQYVASTYGLCKFIGRQDMNEIARGNLLIDFLQSRFFSIIGISIKEYITPHLYFSLSHCENSQIHASWQDA